MGKLETIKPIVRSRSTSSSLSTSSDDESDYDDIDSTTSSSDSDLSLIQTSAIKRSIPTSVHLLPSGTLLTDVNNNQWILHQCLKLSHDHERFIYLCSQVKRSSTNNDIHLAEQNIVQTKISPMIDLPEKFHQSRQTVIDKARTENNQLDYVFYGATIGQTNEEK